MARTTQNSGSPGNQAGPQLILAAFGKHPGWDDHIPGIGVQTVGLANVKQTLYVSGIGGQIDSGAWDKLEPEKRLAGFDHTFLWSLPESLIYGRFWSSRDRRGRSKYPMVLCVEVFGASPSGSVQFVQPELERLKSVCQQAATAEEVTEACRASQTRLDERCAQAGGSPTSSVPKDLRRAFLDHAALGPGRAWLLRVLHEITRGLGTGGEARCFHLRVPLCARAEAEAELLWLEFLRSCLPGHIPMLLTARAGAGFLDVLLGEPGGGEFFCLQASPKALPLATEIPYEIEPELKARLEQVQSRFLEDKPGSKAGLKPATPPTAPKPAFRPEAAQPTGSSRGRRGWWIFGGGVGLFLLIGVGFLLFRGRDHEVLPEHPGVTTGQTGVVQAAVSNVPPVVQQEEADFKRALEAAQAALEKDDLPAAIQMAERALVLRPGDPQATQIRQQADHRLTERKYGDALRAAREAFAAGQWEAAANQAGTALQLKPGDAAAGQLKTDAEKELAKASEATEAARNYAEALAAGRAAFGERNWQAALTRADEALTIKPGDPDALKLRADAEGELAKAAELAAKERRYQEAMAAGQEAFTQGQWETAKTCAEVALAIKPGDAPAEKLRQDSHARLTEAADLLQARKQFEQGNYANVLSLCGKHASVKGFQDLKAEAQTEQSTLDNAQASFAKADYSFLDEIAGQSYAKKAPFQTLLKNARAEQQLLAALEALKAQNNWSALLNRTSEISPQTLAKPPFAKLVEWARPYAEREQAAGKLKDLDTRLQILLVRFGVLKPSDKRVTSPEAQALKPWPPKSIPLDARQDLLKGLEALEAEYRAGGWLNQDGRQQYIDELKDRIPTW